MRFYAKMLSVTDRIALELQELGLRIAKEAIKKDGKIDRRVFDIALSKWAKNSIKSYCAMVLARMNSRDTRAARRNQCIYACAMIDKENFTYRDIEAVIRRIFTETTKGVTLNVSGELSKLAQGDNPLLKRVPTDESYRLASPKVRMAIRTTLSVKDGRVARTAVEV